MYVHDYLIAARQQDLLRAAARHRRTAEVRRTRKAQRVGAATPA